MRRPALLLVLALAGCGGAPFSLLEQLPLDGAPAGETASGHDPEAGVDAAEAGVDAAAVDAGLAEAEASPPAPEAGADAGADDAQADADAIAEAEAGPTCTPFASTGARAYACTALDAGDHARALPTWYAWENDALGLCGWAMTPAACRCTESYSCACLHAAGVCTGLGAGWSWQSCNDQTAPAVSVLCAP